MPTCLAPVSMSTGNRDEATIGSIVRETYTCAPIFSAIFQPDFKIAEKWARDKGSQKQVAMLRELQCARESPGREDANELKPCTASQRVQLLPGRGAARQPEASVAWRAATPVVKRYTAGGEATLLSLEILNVDAFVLVIAGAAPEAPRQVRRNGSSGVRERLHSHGMARRGTWEAPYCPRMKAGTRTTGRNKGSWPAPACGGSGANKQAQRGTGW